MSHRWEKVEFRIKRPNWKWEDLDPFMVLDFDLYEQPPGNSEFDLSTYVDQKVYFNSLALQLSKIYHREVRWNFKDCTQGHYVLWRGEYLIETKEDPPCDE